MNLEPTTQRFQAPDGATITVHQWPQQAHRPALHFAHANGFHGRCYAPLLAPLSEELNIQAWDMRGHGLSRQAGQLNQFKSWQTYYHDMVAYLDQCKEPVWLAGHSVGGTTSLAAACQRPDKVKGLILVDPVLFPAWVGWMLRGAKWVGKAQDFGLAKGAARRRHQFDSIEQAFNNYRQKSAFKRWSDDWLLAYTQHGLVQREQGGVELACHPQWESVGFTHTEPNALSWLKPLQCPVHFVVAEQGSTFPKQNHARVLKRLPQATLTIRPNTSHFLPMEDTAWLGQQMRRIVLGSD